MDGQLVLYDRCRVCGHVGEILQSRLDPEVLPADLKPSLRCSQCGTRGEVEVRLGLSGGAAAFQGARNDRETPSV